MANDKKSIYVRNDTHKRIRLMAAEQEVAMADIVERLVLEARP